jgi:hypothetical protein
MWKLSIEKYESDLRVLGTSTFDKESSVVAKHAVFPAADCHRLHEVGVSKPKIP